MRKIVLSSSLIILLGLVACSHKKVQDDAANNAISSEPMSFAVEGSDSGKIDGLESIHFKYDTSLVDKENRAVLAKNIDWMRAHPDQQLQIEGHCDQRGSEEYNIALGERRAKAAYDYMVGLGADRHHLTRISYGKAKLLTTDDSDEAMAKNRRDNFMPSKYIDVHHQTSNTP